MQGWPLEAAPARQQSGLRAPPAVPESRLQAQLCAATAAAAVFIPPAPSIPAPRGRQQSEDGISKRWEGLEGVCVYTRGGLALPTPPSPAQPVPWPSSLRGAGAGERERGPHPQRRAEGGIWDPGARPAAAGVALAGSELLFRAGL